MLSHGSAEHEAFVRACHINKSDVIDAVEAAGAANASAECHFVGIELDSILENLTTRETLWIDGRYPAACVDEWFTSAGIARHEECSTKIGAACDRYLQELIAESASGKALRSNDDLHATIKKIGNAERALAQSLGELRQEATRPGHAATARGDIVRALYQRVQQILLSPLAQHQMLGESEFRV